MIPTSERATRRPGANGRGRRGADPPGGRSAVMDTSTGHARTARHERLWAMTSKDRVAAFYRGDLTFDDCLAWSRRYPDEPPTGPCGEYLYILVTTPEWLGEV